MLLSRWCSELSNCQKFLPSAPPPTNFKYCTMCTLCTITYMCYTSEHCPAQAKSFLLCIFYFTNCSPKSHHKHCVLYILCCSPNSRGKAEKQSRTRSSSLARNCCNLQCKAKRDITASSLHVKEKPCLTLIFYIDDHYFHEHDIYEHSHEDEPDQAQLQPLVGNLAPGGESQQGLQGSLGQ